MAGWLGSQLYVPRIVGIYSCAGATHRLPLGKALGDHLCLVLNRSQSQVHNPHIVEQKRVSPHCGRVVGLPTLERTDSDTNVDFLYQLLIEVPCLIRVDH